jgi:two-component system, OmpR family, sensor histidine kinase KdpD
MNRTHGTRLQRNIRPLRIAATLPFIALVAFIAYQFHAKALTAGLIELSVVMLIAFRWGFIEAAFGSVAAVAFLDFFYMPPIFSFYETDPQDWISSAIFALMAIFVSRFADRLRRQAIDTNRERLRLERLYQASRDVIAMDRQQEAGAQLTHLIWDIFRVESVVIWDAHELRMDKAGTETVSDDEVRSIYFHEISEDDAASCKFKRVLRLGTKPVGALCIAVSSEGDYLDSRSVDAIASLAAITLERARSLIAESNAEAVKRSEQLRSTVLDGLAHAFKTPLATIQTASSGLLEIAQLGDTEKELASLIEEEAAHLANLTHQVLQTAELAEGLLKVDGEYIDLDSFLEQCREQFTPILADHALRLSAEASVGHVWGDLHLLQMALFQMIDNASKYARIASPVVLRVASTDSEVIFSVENEGSYIAPGERTRIFERFYRSPETHYKASGTGIGLSITKRIAEAHRGRVWVESDSETGTVMFLALPQLQKEV